MLGGRAQKMCGIFTNHTLTMVEWEFIISLPYDAHCEEDGDLIRDLYMLQLKRVSLYSIDELEGTI